MKPAVILLSGGLDSSTTLAIAKDEGFKLFALSVFYGQKNQVELNSAKAVAADLGVFEHKILNLDLKTFGGSSLTTNKTVLAHSQQDPSAIPNTYVPARNTIMLSLALAYAEVHHAYDIFFGANVHDYSGYPDCRPEYVKAYEAMANQAVKYSQGKERIHIHAPLVNLKKAQIIKKGIKLGVRYELTHSCYDPKDELACGICSACYYRHKGFLEAGIQDPTKYKERLQWEKNLEKNYQDPS